MPVQRLDELPSIAPALKARITFWVFLARLAIFGGAAIVTAIGVWQMYLVISVGPTVTTLQWLLLALFTINFSWIALGFTSAIAGFVLLLKGRTPDSAAPLNGRTALLLPIYNEPPDRVFGAAEAMLSTLAATGHGAHFELALLSDSTDPALWIAEERAFIRLRTRLDESGVSIPVWYRHRSRNVARKSGNIAEFIKAHGARYEHLLVLDADSLMSAEAILTLAREMEADPACGLIQTAPAIINQRTVFARLQQFAGRIYGPVIAGGLAVWMGDDGNFWGHNAILRTRAFAESCGLPELSGKPPFGGHILSHDFVEAALMRRRGWRVRLLPHLPGSYEECPPALIDLAARDRRWAQGNLQHARVIGTRGLTLASRQHFLTGIFTYLSAPLWLFQLAAGLVLTWQATYLRPEYFTPQFTLFPSWPRFDAERSLWLLGGTMAILLAPKLLGLAAALWNRAMRKGCGGAFRLIASTFIEIAFSALLAPLLMLIQSRSIYEILAGRDSGWLAQRREDGGRPLGLIIRAHLAHTLLGIVMLGSALLLASSLAAWMAPTVIGLILSIPLSWLTGLAAPGLFLRRCGLLQVPEEISVPPIALAAAKTAAAYGGLTPANPLEAVAADRTLFAAHRAALSAPARQRGEIDPVSAIASAKLAEAQSVQEAATWLSQREVVAVLAEPALLDRLRMLEEAGTISPGGR